MDQLCPHCGYYCTGKSIFCLPPIVEEVKSQEDMDRIADELQEALEEKPDGPNNIHK